MKRNRYSILSDSIVFINPEWQITKENISGDTNSYFYRRELFFEKYRKKRENHQFLSVEREDILLQLANLKQLTFEVTDACNLKCKYCAFGEFYNDYDRRESQSMDFESVKKLVDYLIELWNSPLNQSHGKAIYVSFYGGEPLMNMPFVEKMVSYIRSKNLLHNTVIFSMTTNGVLLKKYMDYLVKTDFRLLISLDGNEYNHSYRVFHNGQESFSLIKKNLDDMKKHYPSYFKKNIDFNAVLHKRNSVSEIYRFIKGEYDKIPQVGELNNMGIREEKIEEFERTYKNVSESLAQSEEADLIREGMLANLGEVKEIGVFLTKHSGNIFQDYNVLFSLDNNNTSITPTGTCLPFSKKLFVTVNGKIMPCERIGHQFALGKVSSEELDLDLEAVAEKYNDYFKRISRYCSLCYRMKSCTQCIFNLKNIDDNPIVCPSFIGKKEFMELLNNQMNYLESNRHLYRHFLEDIVLQF